jgi:hypothetical protein
MKMSSNVHIMTFPQYFMPTKRRKHTEHVPIPPSQRTVHEQLDSMIAAISAAIAIVGSDSSDSDDSSDDRIPAASDRESCERCSQCHRCHAPSRRCRCYACGCIHPADHPCSVVNGAVQRCMACNRFHAPGPCDPQRGPVPVLCGQCGRMHLPGTRCKCRTCGRVHYASNNCELILGARSEQVAFEGAALCRGHVTAYDKGAPTEECPYCGALFFEDEARYINCCRKGTIVVHQKDIPSALLDLITDTHVHSHIRQYNAAVAMASVGYSGDTLGRNNADAPGRPHVDGYGELHGIVTTIVNCSLQVH